MKDSRFIFRWREAVLSTSGPPAMRRHVLVTLSTFADPDGSSCFPSTQLLADRTGLSRRRVEGHLREAAEEGWIRRRARGDGQSWRRWIYTLAIPDVGTKRPHLRGDETSAPHADVETERPHDSPEGEDVLARRGDETSSKVGTKRPITYSKTYSKTSLLCDESHDGDEDSRDFPSLATLPRLGRRRIYPPAFEGAFRALPVRHVAHPKADAYRAWRLQAREADELFQLEAAAGAYNEDVQQKEMDAEFVMMASTFFGPGERWRSYSGIETSTSTGQNGERPFGPRAARMYR